MPSIEEFAALAGKEQGLEIAPMAKALGISRQTAYSWLGGR